MTLACVNLIANAIKNINDGNVDTDINFILLQLTLAMTDGIQVSSMLLPGALVTPPTLVTGLTNH